jgi:hypothetical protein
MTDHTHFNNIVNFNQKGLYSQIETNLKDFMDWSFLNIYAYNNVNIVSGVNPQIYTLHSVSASGTVSHSSTAWEGPFKDWICDEFPSEICTTGAFSVPFLTDWRQPKPDCVPSGEIPILDIPEAKRGFYSLSILASGTHGLNPSSGDIFSSSGCTNLIYNGNFEMTEPLVDGGIAPYWSVKNVDITGFSSPKNVFVDLNSCTAGSISQTIKTVPGATYVLSFMLSGNCGCRPDLPCQGGTRKDNIYYNKTCKVKAGNVSQDFSFDCTGIMDVSTYSSMGWVPKNMTFVATSSHTKISFESISPKTTCFGAMIDNVCVIPLQCTTCETNNSNGVALQGRIGKGFRFNVGDNYHDDHLTEYGKLFLFTNTEHNYSQSINLTNSTLEAIYKHELSPDPTDPVPPCFGGHVCNRARFNILLNNVFVLEANLNNIGVPDNGPPLLTDDGIGSSSHDRYSSVVISSGLSQQIFASGNNSLNISIIPHPQNPQPHEGITWIRLKDSSGSVLYSSCLPQGSGSLNICGPTPSGNWEGSYTLCNKGIPSPIGISGVYLNNTFLPAPTGSGNYGYHINYPLGRVVFDKPVNSKSSVKLEYSYRQVQIYKSEDASWWKEIQKNNYGAFNDSTFTNQLLAEHKLQPPFIMIETIARNNQIPYEIGNSSNILDQDILFHVFTRNPSQRSNLIDILLSQKDKGLILYDLNKVIADDVYGLNYRGEKNINGLNYGQLVTDPSYFYRQCYVKNSTLSELNQFSTTLYNGIVRWTLEIFP